MITHSVLGFCQWLNDTRWSTTLREGDWEFGVIKTSHVLSLGFSVGTVLWLDLRLLGLAMRKQPMADVIARFEPWAVGGFTVMLLSGFLLVFTEPLKCYGAPPFRIKVVLLILAGLNVWYFHKRVARDIDRWGESPPLRAKMVGAASLLLWLGIIVAGRLTAFYGPG